MLKDKTFWKIHFKWGVIAGALLAGIEILKMLARQVDYQSAQLLDLAMIIGFILVLHFGVKEFKEVYPARLTFAKAFLSCIVISFIGAVLLFGYDMLHYSVIEKMAYTDAASALLNERKDRICNDSSVVFKVEGDLTDKTEQKQIRDEINSGTLLVQQYYVGKLCSKPESDKEQYTLGHFTPYAKRVLIETLVSYIDQNKEKPSTPYVQGIVQETNVELDSIDPLDKRFEETKSRVPRYDRNGQYAAVSAMMYLLYGMFFGLFVAMFHYTSKKPIEEFVPTEAEQNEQ